MTGLVAGKVFKLVGSPTEISEVLEMFGIFKNYLSKIGGNLVSVEDIKLCFKKK